MIKSNCIFDQAETRKRDNAHHADVRERASWLNIGIWKKTKRNL